MVSSSGYMVHAFEGTGHLARGYMISKALGYKVVWGHNLTLPWKSYRNWVVNCCIEPLWYIQCMNLWLIERIMINQYSESACCGNNNITKINIRIRPTLLCRLVVKLQPISRDQLPGSQSSVSIHPHLLHWEERAWHALGWWLHNLNQIISSL